MGNSPSGFAVPGRELTVAREIVSLAAMAAYLFWCGIDLMSMRMKNWSDLLRFTQMWSDGRKLPSHG